MKKTILTLASVCMALSSAFAGDAPSVITLPSPDKTGGKPLMEVLTARKTERQFKPDAPIKPQDLSNLLYAAWGINRPDGRRTVPTAMNRQDIDVYVLFPSGVYRYDAKNNALVLWREGDLRGMAFMRPELPLSAALVLVYTGRKIDGKTSPFTPSHAGSAYQNVYLYCASAGLASVVCAGFNHKAMTEKMDLPDDCYVLFTHCIGYPAE